ncbi:subtilisin-like protein [Trichocladium antarcticum]|uniref:Subtilisin-like protein n=1 Tax=Trichocladium antarcticum TaxID=1450529 RepID=A0AAN6UND9_9PEZI|nr:subtilisin-like protein [Trichocladium antarcticum]
MSTLIQARLAWDKNAGKLVDFNVIDAPAAGFTAFIYLTRVRKDYLENELVGKFGMSDSGIIITADIEPPPAEKRSPTEDAYYDDNTTPYHNDTETGKHNLVKRISSLGKWNPSMISVPPKIGWLRAGTTYKYQRDASECGGQYVYISEDAIQTTAFGHANVETLTSQDYGIWRANSVDSLGHATRVASMVVGKENGVCPLGKVTLVTTVLGPRSLRWNPERNAKSSYLKLLESLVMMLQDIKSKGRQGKAVINMSWSVLVDGVILQELDKLNTVLVTSAGNEGKVMYRYPNLFEDDGLNNLIVVGAVNSFGEEASFSDMGIQLTVHAPGQDVHAAKLDGSLQAESGTSYSSPMVAGLVAYFRALPGFGSQLDDPARVKMLVKKMRRTVQILKKPHSRPNKPVIWNGQLSDDVTCITLGDTPPGCPKIDIDDETPLDDLVCATANGLAVRQIGGSCPIDPGNGGGGGGQPSQGPTKIITYNSGTPSPTCTSGCGKLCTDYWCRPDRTGQPVHFTDPTNMPNTTAPWDGGGGGGSIPTNCTVSTVTQTCNGLGGNRSCRPLTICLTTDISTAAPPSSAYCISNTGCSEPFTDISTAAPPDISTAAPPDIPTAAPPFSV